MSTETENRGRGADADVAPDYLLRLREVLKRVPVSKASWYRLMARGEAPKPVHLGSSVFWRASELSAWIASLK